jgi:hypothetical protein
MLPTAPFEMGFPVELTEPSFLDRCLNSRTVLFYFLADS